MKKLYVIIPTIVLILSSIFVILSLNQINTDSVKFKQEYESLNNKVNDSGKKYRNITIAKDNPFVYKTAEDIVDMMDKKESFIVYFGFNSCPWCRSVLPTLIDVLKDLDIDEVYYVDVKDIRDVIEIKDDKLKTTKKGTDGYYKLIDKLKNVLKDYELTDDGETLKTGEARIYAPNIVKVEKGEGVKIATGVSKLQSDAYMKLTDEMIEETYNEFKRILK